MKLILLFFIFLFIESKFRPRLEYIEESKLLILFYSEKFTRKYFVVWKF